MADIQTRNQMTGVALKEQEGSKIDFATAKDGVHKKFRCGSISGYASEAAFNCTDINSIVVAECSIDGGNTWVWTMMCQEFKVEHSL